MLKLKVKKLNPKAKLPTKNHITDAGFDLYAVEDAILYSGTSTKIDTGIAVEIPEGYVGVIFDRSSMGAKGIHRHCGVIDSSYRGPLIVCLNNTNLPQVEYKEHERYYEVDPHNEVVVNPDIYEVKRGDKIAQMLILPVPAVVVEEVDELGESDRGAKGFGSSGK